MKWFNLGGTHSCSHRVWLNVECQEPLHVHTCIKKTVLLPSDFVPAHCVEFSSSDSPAMDSVKCAKPCRMAERTCLNLISCLHDSPHCQSQQQSPTKSLRAAEHSPAAFGFISVPGQSDEGNAIQVTLLSGPVSIIAHFSSYNCPAIGLRLWPWIRTGSTIGGSTNWRMCCALSQEFALRLGGGSMNYRNPVQRINI
jgi:hypothetical protein